MKATRGKCFVAGAACLLFLSAETIHADSPDAVLSKFSKAWRPIKGYMRPLDDPGWKVRIEAFQQLVRLGEKALPSLTAALEKGEPQTRIFAAQALTFLAKPQASPELWRALKDPLPAVRLYAIDALSMFGKLKEEPQFRELRDKDSNRDVRSHMTFALARDEDPQVSAMQKTLLEYDLTRQNSAQVGKPAPDFTLADPLGKIHSLSSFKGKKAVVLVFIYGDT